MAYDSNFPPIVTSYSPVGVDFSVSGPKIYSYKSDEDTQAEIATNGYFSDASSNEMNVGDIICVTDILNTTVIYYISSFTSTAANLTRVSGGSSGGTVVPVNVTASGSITSVTTGNSYTNNGAVGSVVLTLPAAAVGIGYSMYVATAQNFEFLAVGSDVIKNGADAGTAGGNISAATIGNYVNLQCLVAGIWSVTNMIGDWTLT